MRKQFPLILAALFVVSLLFLYDIEITNPSLATDSGFDTSYDSGSSGGSGGGGFSGSDYSSDGSSGSSSSGRPMTAEETAFFLLIFPIVLTAVWHPQKRWKKIVKMILRISVVIIYIFLVYYTLSHTLEFSTGILMFIAGVTLIASFVEDSSYIRMDSSDISNQMEREYRIQNYMSKSSIELDVATKEKVFKQSYQIYLQVQEAWMNFDYEKLRTLVTDELFNTYQTQLQTLELKGQKNIMKDFVLLDWKLLSANEENSIRTISTLLDVEFYDYIVDTNDKVVRGNKKEKVIMTYCLTFVEKEEKEINCPHCGAKLEKGITICPYCKTNIQGITTMKLSKKEAIYQRKER